MDVGGGRREEGGERREERGFLLFKSLVNTFLNTLESMNKVIPMKSNGSYLDSGIVG